MSNYNPLTNFTAKDSLTTGDPQKIIRGTDFDAEFDSISTAVNSKADANNAALTGSSSAVNLDVTGTFELGGTAVTATATELNILDGVTSTTVELNLLDGVTATTAELNQLDGNVFTADLTITDKIIHAGDTNTAIRFPANDTVTIETGGTERVRVTSTGNVGIGTTSPDSKLHVKDSAGSRIHAETTSTTDGHRAELTVKTGSQLVAGGSLIATNANETTYPANAFGLNVVEAIPLWFGTGNTERMRITGTGNVGINNNNPSSVLDVNGDVTVSDKIRHSGDTNTSIRFPAADTFTVETGGSERVRVDSSGRVGLGNINPSSRLHVLGSNTVSGKANVAASFYAGGSGVDAPLLLGSTSGNRPFIGAFDGPTTSVGSLDFFVDDASSPRMRIDSYGNVGIGTSSLGMNAAGLPLVVGSGSGNTGMTIYSGAASSGSIHFGDTVTTGADSYSGFVNYSHSTNSMQLGTSGVEKMRIDSTGNVGIGTTSPTSALTVSGRIETVDGADIDMDGSASGHLMLDGAGYGAAIALNAQGANFYTNSASRGIIFGVNETEVMRVTNGSVGIGTSSPSSFVSSADDLVIGNTSAGDSGITIATNTSSKGNLFFADGTTGSDVFRGAIQYDHAANDLLFVSNGFVRGRFDSNGYLLIDYASSNGAYKLQVNSQIFATNATIATSDARYKENVMPLGDVGDVIDSLTPVCFDWKQGTEHNFLESRDVGLIAQDVETVLANEEYGDSVVAKGEIYGLAYEKLIPLLLKEVQSLRSRVAELESKV